MLLIKIFSSFSGFFGLHVVVHTPSTYTVSLFAVLSAPGNCAATISLRKGNQIHFLSQRYLK